MSTHARFRHGRHHGLSRSTPGRSERGKARFYSPYIMQFHQPDTLIPEPYNPQSYNRYSYVKNNPLKYTDPSGHKVTCDVDENCKQSQRLSRFTGVRFWKALMKDEFGIKMSEEDDANNTNAKAWDLRNLMIVYNTLGTINVALNGRLKSLVGGATFKWGEHDPNGGNTTYRGLTYSTTITFYTIGNAAIRQMNIFHEFGHLMDNSPGMVNVFSRNPDINNPDFLDDNGYLDRSALIDRSQDMYQHPMSIYGDDPASAQEEHWGDIFANYVAGNINLASTEGQAMNTFVTGALAPYIGTP
ncbi:MAG: RHS repeat-associated core domain-containing protein [Anaerolineales bacterium]|nr:MAG: RHS repeat-associated core domain-containing protein [Anaerolineales bacterium]